MYSKMSPFAVGLAWMFLALASSGDAKSFTRRKAPLQGTMIVGGTAASQGQFPYQLEILRYDSHYCGASLVEVDGLQVAITAAHCISTGQPQTYMLVAGELALSQVSGLEQTRSVTRAVNHPNYDSWLLQNDISILFFNEPFNLTDNVKLIPLPERLQEIAEGKNITVSGWGDTSYGGQTPNLLQYVDIPVISNERCEETWSGSEIVDSELCAGKAKNTTGEVSPCHGDSGGPAKSEEGYLAGIVSWGDECETQQYPAVFTKVSHFVDWIEDTVTEHKGGRN